MTHPGGDIKAWSLDASGQPWKAISHSKLSWGQLRSSGKWSSLILPSALPCFFPPDSTVLIPRATLIQIPALNSIRVCIPENQPATRIRKHSIIWEDFYWKLLVTHVPVNILTLNVNILKTPNKIQNGRNKDLQCECSYPWLKIHNLMLSHQMKLSYILITKEKYMLNHMKMPFYSL